MIKEVTAPTNDETTKTPPVCLKCDGSGMICNRCGESESCCTGDCGDEIDTEGEVLLAGHSVCEECGGEGRLYDAEKEASNLSDELKKLCYECHGAKTVCSGCGLSTTICNGICNSNIKTPFPSQACPNCCETEPLGDEEVTVSTPELVEAQDDQDERDIEPANETLRLDRSKATDSAAALARYDNETRLMVDEINVRVFELLDKYEEWKNEANQAKKAYEAADEEMRKLIRERRMNRGIPQQPHLFDESQNAEKEQRNEGLTDSPDKDLPPDEWKPNIASEPTAPSEPSKPIKPQDETWKLVPLSSLSLKPGILKKLESPIHKDTGPIPPITTMGELTAYQEPTATGFCHRLIDIKGIGQAAADEIAEACIEFWAARNAKKKVAA